jgi:hypothetical protein
MDEMQQFQEEYEQRLAEALDKVEQGFITPNYMCIIRHACNLSKPKKPTIFNFDEIFGEIK